MPRPKPKTTGPLIKIRHFNEGGSVPFTDQQLKNLAKALSNHKPLEISFFLKNLTENISPAYCPWEEPLEPLGPKTRKEGLKKVEALSRALKDAISREVKDEITREAGLIVHDWIGVNAKLPRSGREPFDGQPLEIMGAQLERLATAAQMVASDVRKIPHTSALDRLAWDIAHAYLQDFGDIPSAYMTTAYDRSNGSGMSDYMHILDICVKAWHPRPTGKDIRGPAQRAIRRLKIRK